jgi:hypothetical protein
VTWICLKTGNWNLKIIMSLCSDAFQIICRANAHFACLDRNGRVDAGCGNCLIAATSARKIGSRQSGGRAPLATAPQFTPEDI